MPWSEIFVLIFWACSTLILYTYFGYPIVLRICVAFWSRPVKKEAIEPEISVLVAAHNEEAVIQAKIENVLASNYPIDKIEIVIASDGSTDRTVEIAQQFQGLNTRVLNLERCGKISALNCAASRSSGAVLVFTDANTFLEPDALSNLVRNFSDPLVGGVCGNQMHFDQPGPSTASDSGERLYWRYDKWLKTLESRIGSIVGADGSLYAIRRNLFAPVTDPDQADDFIISAQIVERGSRLVFEPDAVCYETAPESSSSEFFRKVRIANHSTRTLANLSKMLNPFRGGLYSFSLWSHKLLRYVVPFLMIAAFASNLVAWSESPFYRFTLSVQVLFYSVAFIGFLTRQALTTGQLFSGPYFFCLANLAVMFGVLGAAGGVRINRWETNRPGAKTRVTEDL